MKDTALKPGLQTKLFAEKNQSLSKVHLLICLKYLNAFLD
jgi:hypothetical protein